MTKDKIIKIYADCVRVRNNYPYALAYIVEQDKALSEALDKVFKDVDRYKWLRSHGCCPWAETDYIWDDGSTIDEAIDDAIAQDKS